MVMKSEHKHNKFDLNRDGCVDEADLVIIAMAFGSQRGDKNYNPHCDFDKDGFVNSNDFLLLRSHMGEGCDDTPGGM